VISVNILSSYPLSPRLSATEKIYLGEGVLSQAGIENGVGDLVTVRKALLDTKESQKKKKKKKKKSFSDSWAILTQSCRGDLHRPTRM
jgi:hypothetical protein